MTHQILLGLGGLFNFDIDGDVGDDPNFMTLWFFQPDLGLPSKVRVIYESTPVLIYDEP